MKTKILSEADLVNVSLLPLGKKHPVRALLEVMETDQLLSISRQDFRWKRHTPNLFCKQISKRSAKRFEIWKLADQTGWVVKRTQ